MLRPSIRAHGFQRAADELRELLAQGRLDGRHVEARLSAHDLELLETKLDPDAWVPIESHARVLDLLADAARGDRAAFHRTRGMRMGEDLACLDEEPSEADAEATAGDRVLLPARLVTRSQRELYSFMSWHVEAGSRPDSFVIRLEQAAALPLATQQALEGMAAYAAAYVLDARFVVSSRRPAPDRVRVEGWRR